MAKMDIKVRTEMCLEDSCVRYVIVYTNGRIVQGHRVYCLASRVNIFSQGKVQRVTPTSPMQVSTVASITKCLAFSHQFRSCGELLDIVNEMDDIHWRILCS